MKDTIYREDAIKVTWQEPSYTDAINALTEARERIKDIPTIEPKQGKWELSAFQNDADVANGNYAFICSNCKHTDIHAMTQEVPYCWWCGSRMKDVQIDMSV